jgi:hypothetical protein
MTEGFVVDVGVAVETLYRVFGRYPRRAEVESCPCCVSSADKHVLARVSLRELNAAELSRYAFKAMTTWGAVEDYKHFLPRILELIAVGANDAYLGLQLDLVADKLHHGGLSGWPPAERDALHRYTEALWRELLRRDPDDRSESATEILAGCAHMIGDVQPFLDAWEHDDALPARVHLATAITHNIHAIAGAGDSGPTWRNQAAQVVFLNWLRDPKRAHDLKQSFEHNFDDPRSTQIAQALDLLQWSQP